MLIGVIFPSIMLPDTIYTNTQLSFILMHELTHKRRHDVILKWFSALVGALHWFNPIIYFVRREIKLSCELACDAAVISSLDANGKQNYGDTLIAIAKNQKPLSFILATMMYDEKRVLRERLDAIMRNRKFSSKATVLACVFLTTIVFWTGALCTAGGSAGEAFYTLPSASSYGGVCLRSTGIVINNLLPNISDDNNPNQHTVSVDAIRQITFGHSFATQIEAGSDADYGRYDFVNSSVKHINSTVMPVKTLVEAKDKAAFNFIAPTYIPERTIIEAIYLEYNEIDSCAYAVVVCFSIDVSNSSMITGSLGFTLSQYYVGPDAYLDIVTMGNIEKIDLGEIEALLITNDFGNPYGYINIDILWINDETVFWLHSTALFLEPLLTMANSI